MVPRSIKRSFEPTAQVVLNIEGKAGRGGRGARGKCRQFNQPHDLPQDDCIICIISIFSRAFPNRGSMSPQPFPTSSKIAHLARPRSSSFEIPVYVDSLPHHRLLSSSCPRLQLPASRRWVYPLLERLRPDEVAREHERYQNATPVGALPAEGDRVMSALPILVRRRMAKGLKQRALEYPARPDAAFRPHRAAWGRR